MTNQDILKLVNAGFTANQITAMIESEKPAPTTTPEPATTPTPTTTPKPTTTPTTTPEPTTTPAPTTTPVTDNEPFKELVEEIKSLKAVMQLRNADEVSFLNPKNENKITTASITAEMIGGEY